MALRVIGAGFGRTGTMSLKLALERLGFVKCYHMFEVMQNPAHVPVWSQAHAGGPVDWDALFDGYQAIVDWPGCNLWREICAHYPDAKVVLSLRDPDRWYDSVMETIYAFTQENLASDDERRRAGGRWAMEIVWNRVFDGRMDDRAHVIDVFQRHNESVKAEVPPHKLLVFEAAEGWEPLCRFLDVEIPDEDFPRTNTREEFGARRVEPRSS